MNRKGDKKGLWCDKVSKYLCLTQQMRTQKLRVTVSQGYLTEIFFYFQECVYDVRIKL
jgi:hypothetical protein